MKLGIISDTHITSTSKKDQIKALFEQLEGAFKGVDKIIHAGDVSEEFFLNKLKNIAPITCVKGNVDNIESLEQFVKISHGRYNIGVIHILPENLEEFMKEYDLNIIIFGHTHIPLIKGTKFNTLLVNPGSPTEPKSPPQKPGFLKPVARPSVITLNIDENDVMSTFIITLKI
ncbi:MAG: metallophosphoesterase family protein [Candidatus Lokiarchaeota archaeon]|nr:metallophosphoesterase family protein [Candidatus Lokiarchaeota archaeon]